MSNTLHDRPQPKRQPSVPQTEVRVKSEGSSFERNRYIGRSDTGQARYFEVSIEEPLNIPIRVRKIDDPPLSTDSRTPDRWLEMNIGSVESARKLQEALSNALDEYDSDDQQAAAETSTKEDRNGN